MGNFSFQTNKKKNTIHLRLLLQRLAQHKKKVCINACNTRMPHSTLFKHSNLPGILLHVSLAHVFTLNVCPCCFIEFIKRKKKSKNNKIELNLSL